MKSLIYIIIPAVFFWSCGPKVPLEVKDEMANLPNEIDYNLHIKPILSDKCFNCHGPDQAKRKAGLRLDMAANAFAQLPENKSKVAIEPGDWADSELAHRILSADPEYMMPTPNSHQVLSNYEKALLLKWIDQGAEYKPHWAFIPPVLPEIPSVKNEKWPQNAIDYFVLEKLDEQNLNPSAKADKETLLRRVSLDLTGLPPTLSEMDAFLQDQSANAYQKVVDRLLKSPHFGERMAVDWLDLARFADSHGYTVDRLRDMSPYRDWVIEAFNKNMPYDQFVTWQLAGDLLPKPTKPMLIATAFNRNHQQNMEGGIIEKEFQTEYVMDRTNTFGQAFLGLSVSCARCHDHKYDPITQKNYYELFSFFNNIKEAGQIAWDDTMPSPTLLLPTKKQEELLKFIKNDIAKNEGLLNIEKEKFAQNFNTWLPKNEYQNILKTLGTQTNLLAQFDFENKSLKNKVNSKQAGFMNSLEGKTEAVFTNTIAGNGLKLDGDSWFDTDGLGAFRMSDSFTIGLWINIDKASKEGVIFNKTIGERLYNYKGFHVYMLPTGHLQLTMAHAAPANAITKISKNTVPKGEWFQITLSYDGSQKSSGLKIYVNGILQPMITETDQLIKDINYKNYQKQPGIMVGAWWRGNGLKNAMIDNLVIYDRAITEFEIKVLAKKSNWTNIIKKSYKELNNEEIIILKEYFLSTELAKSSIIKEIKSKKIAYADSLDKVNELMIMQESAPKQSYILNRGNYDSPTEKVYPNTPASLLAYDGNLPKNRLGLAQWLFKKENPLTARVLVNRLWQQFFGIGLVKTAEDFGNQGELPSNLKLLDFLAIGIQQNQWNIKQMAKMIVLSASYQQDSRYSKQLWQKDPENRLLARGPSARLTSEMLRDNALFAAGILKNEIGGQSIKPYQPPGLWEINNTSYKPDSSSIIYKRSLYILVKRSVPNPTLATFDGSARSNCEVRRQKTNTPLQALVTQNDPTFLEACKIIGEQMTLNPNHELAIITAFRKLTGKKPKAAELQILKELYEKEYNKFSLVKSKITGWNKAGYYTIKPETDLVKLAANAVVANVILNSDATLTKR